MYSPDRDLSLHKIAEIQLAKTGFSQPTKIAGMEPASTSGEVGIS